MTYSTTHVHIKLHFTWHMFLYQLHLMVVVCCFYMIMVNQNESTLPPGKCNLSLVHVQYVPHILL